MQQDLDAYLDFYNRKRPHRGRGMDSKTLYQAFKAGLREAKKPTKTLEPGKEAQQAA